jgi:hypothetical protein
MSILLARAIAFIEVQELNPKGSAYFPDIAAALVRRFNFQIYPTKPEDFNEEKGIKFADGKFSDGTLDSLQIFPHGILLDTRVSTDVSAALLATTLRWASSELGLHYEEGMVKRKAFSSQVTFESDMELVKLNPVLAKIGNAVSSNVSGTAGQPIVYEPTGIFLNLDQSLYKVTPGHFSIERREAVPFTDKKYFSSAPLPTQDHLSILQDFENSLLRG